MSLADIVAHAERPGLTELSPLPIHDRAGDPAAGIAMGGPPRTAPFGAAR